MSAVLLPSTIIHVIRHWAMALTRASIRDVAVLVAFALALASSDIPRHVLLSAAANAAVNAAFLSAAAVYVLWFAIVAARDAAVGAREAAWRAAGEAVSVLLRALVLVPLGAAPSAAQAVAMAVFQVAA